MKIKSIAEHYVPIGIKTICGLFESGRFTQVLL